MKIFKKILILGLVLCFTVFFAALFARIYMAENYPKESTKMVMTESLLSHYRETGSLTAYTQDLRVSYDDNKEGNFFAKELIVVPDAKHLQITMRYNEHSLQNVAAAYKLPAVPEVQKGLFRYRLCVSYGTEDYVYYEASYEKEMHRYLYQYTKLAFEGVAFEGAVWMRVEIFYAGDYEGKPENQAEETMFGAIPVYEAFVEWDGEMLENPLKEYRIPQEVLPK
ncbi:MAG: hypothetical protein J6K61_01815 [Clostridia bacterium]|nr:hypothetical protein [Clostridia bacterium]